MAVRVLDGGYGWVVVTATFVITFLMSFTWAPFGVYYMAFVSEFNVDSHFVVWTHSALMFTTGITGTLSALLVRSLGYRKLSLLGALFHVTGCLVASFAHHVSVIIVGYGVMLGLGNSFTFMSAVVAVQDFFDKRRAFATAVSFCGISASIFVTSPLVQTLIDHFGWRGSLFIHSAIMLNGIPAALLLKTPDQCQPRSSKSIVISENVKMLEFNNNPPKQANGKQNNKGTNVMKHLAAAFDFTPMRNKHFCLFLFVGFTFQIGLNVPLVFQISRAVALGTGSHMAALLASSYGIGNAIGRLPVGLLADRVERRILFGLLNGLSGAITLVCSFMYAYPFWVTHAALLGFLSGGVILIMAPTAVDLIGVENIHKGQGLNQLFNGMASMSAAPLAGFLFRMTKSYDMAYLIVGILNLASGGFMALFYISLRVSRSRCKPKTEYQHVTMLKV